MLIVYKVDFISLTYNKEFTTDNVLSFKELPTIYSLKVYRENRGIYDLTVSKSKFKYLRAHSLESVIS